MTIFDNDKGVAFVQSRVWVHEDQKGVRLEVTRGNDGLLDPFTVDYTVANLTALAGEDFDAASGSLSFAVGEMTRAIWVPVVNDGVPEPDQTFRVTLSNPTGGQSLGGTANLTATVTICDTTGMKPRRFQGIQRLGDGSIQLELQGGVHRRFLPYYSIFQLEASADLRQWQPLKLLGYRNNSTNPPVFTDVPAPEATTRFYRVNPTPFVTPSIPPAGPHSVGITRRFLLDPLRRNRFGISTNNSFLVTIWYPANPMPGQPIAGYYPEPLANEVDYNLAAYMDRAPRLASFSILEAPSRPADGGYPVVVNSHCSGCDGGDQENLASHGYIVATIDHADTPFSLLPDGRLVRQTLPAASVAGTLERVKDLGFLIDELGRLNQEDPQLKGAFRFSLLAAMGWSWGAMTIDEFARVEPRCLAAVSLDGGVGALPAEIQLVGLQKPSLTMNRTANSTDILFKFALRDAYWLQINGAIHQDFSTFWWDETRIELGREIQQTLHAYVLSFLNKHLKGEDDHLLDNPSTNFPRVINFKKK